MHLKNCSAEELYIYKHFFIISQTTLSFCKNIDFFGMQINYNDLPMIILSFWCRFFNYNVIIKAAQIIKLLMDKL